jgi:hypothetical protein
METEGDAVKRNVASRTLLKDEGLRHPVRFFRRLNEIGCDVFMYR